MSIKHQRQRLINSKVNHIFQNLIFHLNESHKDLKENLPSSLKEMYNLASEQTFDTGLPSAEIFSDHNDDARLNELYDLYNVSFIQIKNIIKK